MIFLSDQDLQYFAQLYCKGNVMRFEKEFADCFDSRDPGVKRIEFNTLRPRIYKALGNTYGYACMLRILEGCLDTQNLAVDHLIPLSSNELNKKLRSIQPTAGKKVVTQSYGSNSIKNLALACKKCNDFKKHRFLNSKQWTLVQNRKATTRLE